MLTLFHDALLEDRLHQRIKARGWLVQDEQFDIGRQSCDQSDLLPVTLRIRAGLLSGSSSNRSSRSARRRGSSPPRSRPSRSMISPPERFGQRVHRQEHRRVGDAVGWSHARGRRQAIGLILALACRRPSNMRIVVVFPAPLGPRNPCTSPGRTERSSPSRARVRPNDVPGQYRDSICHE